MWSSLCKRALASLGAIALSLYAALRFLMDWVGRTTFSDDLAQLMDEKLPSWAEWLFSTPWEVPAVCAVLLTGWLIWITRPRPYDSPLRASPSDKPGIAVAPLLPPQATEASAPAFVASRFPSGLYVGAMNVDAQHLDHEFYIEISIQGYNATEETISIDEVRGTIALFERVEGKQSEKVNLPLTMALADRGMSRGIANMSEIFIIVNQRVPREIAERALSLLAEGHRIELDFDGWEVVARAAGSPERLARLPVWGGVMLGKRPERIATSKIVKATANLNVGATSVSTS